MAEGTGTRRSIIIWAFVIPCTMAAAIVAVMLYLWAAGKPVPSELLTLATTSTGFVFGSLPGFVKQFLEAKVQ